LLEKVGGVQIFLERNAEKNDPEWQNIFYPLTRENHSLSHRENGHNFMWESE
jgi:hypothetical protein